MIFVFSFLSFRRFSKISLCRSLSFYYYNKHFASDISGWSQIGRVHVIYGSHDHHSLCRTEPLIKAPPAHLPTTNVTTTMMTQPRPHLRLPLVMKKSRWQHFKPQQQHLPKRAIFYSRTCRWGVRSKTKFDITIVLGQGCTRDWLEMIFVTL